MLQSNEVLAGNFAASRRFSSSHNGIDLKSPNGTPVKSRFAGVVRVTGTNPPGKDFGNYIRIYHPQLGISSWYAHLQSFACSVGQQVGQGQVIGYSNNTGFTTGPHLHYSESKGETTQWINPDSTQGGGVDMVNQDLLNAFYLDLLGRLPDPSGNTSYLGQPTIEVYHAIRTSQERVDKLAREAAELNAAKTEAAKVPGLEEQMKQFQGQIVDLNNALENLKQELSLQVAQVASLSKQVTEKDLEVTKLKEQLSTDPTQLDAISLIVLGIRKLLGR